VAHLVGKAAPRIVRSGVVDTETGGSSISDIRTSSGMFFDRAEDPVIKSEHHPPMHSCAMLTSGGLRLAFASMSNKRWWGIYMLNIYALLTLVPPHFRTPVAEMTDVHARLTGIEARVADWLMVPSFNGEGIQVTCCCEADSMASS
jgi:hypothetical protein